MAGFLKGKKNTPTVTLNSGCGLSLDRVSFAETDPLSLLELNFDWSHVHSGRGRHFRRASPEVNERTPELRSLSGAQYANAYLIPCVCFINNKTK